MSERSEVPGGRQGRPGLPPGVDLRGVPRPEQSRQAFVMLLAVAIAALALITTLGWVVYDHLIT